MKKLKIGLNGFGRIGRAFARIACERNTVDLMIINTRKTQPQMLAYLLKHDSVYHQYGKEVSAGETTITVGDRTIATTCADVPESIPWEKYGVDVVVDATGAFVKKADLMRHIKGTVSQVILTAPAKDTETPHVVLGVNEHSVDLHAPVLSMASCTTNCAGPMFKVLHDHFKVVSGFLTTAHAFTLTQSLLDDAGKNVERSRAAGLNIIPSTTGAAKAVARVIPELEGKIDGMAIRVPVPTVSFTDITAVVEKATTVDEVQQAFETSSQSTFSGIMKYEKEILVSSDYIGSPYSCIFDANYTKVINGNFIKVFGWYDNEWGYATRLVDLVEKIAC